MKALWSLVLSLTSQAWAQQYVLTPPYFNIAENRPVTANATCGVGSNVQKEMYCKLVAGFDRQDLASSSKDIVDGQVCDYCYAPGTNVDVTKVHGPENAVDGDISTYWQSPPISRGRKYNRVDLEINLLQDFIVAYVVVTMADSPRPGVWALEKSMDGGKTWKPWQFFAGNDAECQKYFGMHADGKITRDDDVICSTEFSKVLPIEGGEIFVRLTQGRPSENDIQGSDTMMSWLRATNIRLRLMQTKTMLGHLMSVAQGDQTVTRRYYYSIREISVGGRCLCNGHAYVCPPSPSDPNILQCECQRNTAGMNCDICAPGFTQKQWRRYSREDPFECEPCNCNGHSDKCHYNQTIADLRLSMDMHGQYEGGGVCEDCKHFTTGINCHSCINGYFRPNGVMPNETEPCVPCQCGDDDRYTGNCAADNGQCECKEAFRGAEDCSACAQGYYDYPNCKPCDCFPNGTQVDDQGVPICVSEAGLQCPCKRNFGGVFCDECAPGYYDFPTCKRCACSKQNSLDQACDPISGQCSCERTYGGRTCEECNNGFYNYPKCTDCNCDVQGSEPEICNKANGKCLCREGYAGERCDKCKAGWYGYPNCRPCECSAQGSNSPVCEEVSGQCPCFSNYGGRRCDSCTPGYYAYPDCKMCACDSFGSRGLSCDSNGHCTCLPNFMGIKCDQCAPQRFNFPRCEECNCDPRGVADDFFQRGGCANVPKGELCTCKEKVTGRTCSMCKPLYWNLQKWRLDGCEACDCHRPGTIGGLAACDLETGQCSCKPAVADVANGSGSRKCDECRPGFYALSGNSLLGCEACQCDLGGSHYGPGEEPTCSREDGQCDCRYGMGGRRCNQVQSQYYVPTLHQHKFEVEDGYRADGSLVRFGYDQAKFPGFSWRGYAAYSPLQQQVLQDIDIAKGSLYRVVIRYRNPNENPASGTVRMTKIGEDGGGGGEGGPGLSIVHPFVLEPTAGGEPAFATVSGEAGIYPSPYELDPGMWTVALDIENNDPESQEILVDYFVLLPNEYAEPRILKYDIRTPCERGARDFCRDYSYPVTGQFPTGTAWAAVQPGGLDVYPYTGNEDDLLEVGTDKVVQIAKWQPELKWNIPTKEGGKHVLAIVYFTPEPTNGTTISVGASQGEGAGEAYIFACPYATLCRQVVTDPQGRIVEFDLTAPSTNIAVRATTPDTNVAIDRIVLIPLADWTPDYITPMPGCVRDRLGQCRLPGPFAVPPEGSAILLPVDEQIVYKGPPPRGIADPETPLVRLDASQPALNLSGEITQPGTFIIVAQYYQPDHPKQEVKVIISQPDLPPDALAVYEAVLPLPNCPSATGCRQPVLRQPGDSRPAEFQLTAETLDIQFRHVGGPQYGGDGSWIEYALAVPTEEYDDSLLHADSTVDRGGEFIKECGKNAYFVPNNIPDGFCKEAVTSVAAAFNDGAFECKCHPEGSLSVYQCAPFGGQCECRPNVIGRACERCEPGYFGFPECRQCNCPPTATCNEETGECICAPFVTGSPESPCSECEENTFGYDPITGCQECNCMIEGTEGGNMSCSQESGQCYCKANVEGRTCDHCAYGSFQYPDCETCDCDLAGTTERICDQASARCFCKPNVGGERCDTCLEGNFNLQDKNPDGCTECFCFGKTTFCSSQQNLAKSSVADMNGWRGAAWTMARAPVMTSLNLDEFTNYDGSLDMAFKSLEEVNLSSQVFYFSSSAAYRGSRIGSYGATIKYNITYYGDIAADSKKYPDIILEGGKQILLFYSGRKLEYGKTSEISAVLEPRYWLLPTGNQATRPKLMVALNSLQTIYVRGSYGPSTQAQSRLQTVSLETTVQATDEELADPVLTVEQCECPEGYTGSSCQLCAPGYYSDREDLWGPICIKCNCNGHAETCHPRTGACRSYVPLPEYVPESDAIHVLDTFCHFYPDKCMEDPDAVHCRNHTRGDNCELCEVGYYGDATQGTPEACQSCPCPLPDNNFAVSCDGLFRPVADPAEQVCLCQPNYVGDRCQHCGPGYFGQPDQPGGSCQPCFCNGNINTADPGACNRITGRCELCLGHTYGDNCERCEPWYFGDAVGPAKSCRACDCDRDGTAECDHRSGQCHCHPGVEGPRCDRCAANHYGFRAGGCTPCQCSEASEDTQCDLTTGQCRCRPGVTGAKCERCLNGFWNLGPSGCQSCGCNTDYAVGGGCNQYTGQCQCLPGVVGQNCDRCPPNWVLIMNETRTTIPEWKLPFDYEEGCFPCSSCVADIMEHANILSGRLSPVMEEFKETEKSFYAYRRLKFIEEEIDRLRPEIALLDPAEGNKRIQPLEQKVNNLHWTSKSLNLDFKLNLMNGLARQAEDLAADGSNAVAEMGTVGVKVLGVIKDVTEISEALGTGVTAQLLETSVAKGRELLASMQERSFASTRLKAEEEREQSRALIDQVRAWASPVEEFKASVAATNQQLGKFEADLEDLLNRTNVAEAMASQAKAGNFRNSAPQAEGKVRRINQLAEAARASQQLGGDLVQEAEVMVDTAKESYSELADRAESIDDAAAEFKDRLRTFEAEDENMFRLEGEAALRAAQLTDQAAELKNIAARSKRPAETALQAAQAYENILANVREGEVAAGQAAADAEKAFAMSDGVASKTNSALKTIQQMYEEAGDADQSVNNELGPSLATSQAQVKAVSDKTKEIKQNLAGVAKQVEKMGSLSEVIATTKTKAGSAQTDAHDALTSINARATEISRNKDKAYELRDAHSAMSLYIANTEKALNDYEQKPGGAGRARRDAYQESDIAARLLRLTQQKEAIHRSGDMVSDLVSSIRGKISAARDALARIEHPGVAFTRGSHLELELPPALPDLATNTEVSFFVNVSQPAGGEERAFFFYLGNLEDTHKKIPNALTDDYMAVQVVKGGFVSLTMDLGAGPVELVSRVPIAYNEWNKIAVSRQGHDVNLTLSWEEGDGEIHSDTVSDRLPLLDDKGQPFGSVFNLYPEYSRIFVGGFPTESTPVQERVRATDMEGQMEGLMIGGQAVGLWNLKSSKMIGGAAARNKFNVEEGNEARFSGEGSYVSINPTNYYLDAGGRSVIQLRVRPDQPDGLLLMGEGGEALSLGLKDGYVHYSFTPGAGGDPVTLMSPEPLLLDQWSTIKLDRDGGNGVLFIDGNPAATGSSDGSDDPAALPEMSGLFVGGLPPSYSADSAAAFGNYAGCIADLKIEPDHVDLTKGSTVLETANVVSGCEAPSAPQNSLSFTAAGSASGGSFVQLPRLTANGSISVSLGFRTQQKNGLLLYMVDRTELFYVSLAMVDGALHLYAHPDNEVVTKDLQNRLTRYNDNQWHVVSLLITRNSASGENIIRLSLDDNYVAAPYQVANIPLVATGSEYEAYLGGLPDRLRPLRAGVAATETAWVGCLRDAIVLGNYVNFQDAVEVSGGASVGECGAAAGQASGGKQASADGESTDSSPTKSDGAVDQSAETPLQPIDADDASVDGTSSAVEPFDPSLFYTDGAVPPPAERYGLCQLPISPAMDPDLTAESGLRFGTKPDSFIEYFKKKLPDAMVDKYRFALDFKTTFENGLIFYMRHNERADFVALYVKAGRLIYSFDCGSGPSRLSTEFRVDDGQWHAVEFSRVDNEGKLMFNGREVKVADYARFSVGSTKKLEVEPQLYLGGLDADMKAEDRVKRELQFISFEAVPGFVGCLRNIRTEGVAAATAVQQQQRGSGGGRASSAASKMRSLGKWQKNSFVLPCSEKVESGYFFGPEGGRIRAFRKFRVGLDFDITMWIRPRNISGLLLGVKGRRDYVILQMVDGAIQFTVDNGRGPITSLFKPENQFQFCNGDWHEIHAVKAKNVVTLSVNKIFAQPGIGVPGVSSTDTNNPLFLGGHPRPSRLGLDTYANFVGCMRDIVIEGAPLKMTEDMLSGDIHSHVCPTI